MSVGRLTRKNETAQLLTLFYMRIGVVPHLWLLCNKLVKQLFSSANEEKNGHFVKKRAWGKGGCIEIIDNL
jgi:hypothetical protein